MSDRAGSMLDAADRLLRQWDGRLTRELLLAPGQFGLGQVPAKLAPDAATTMVCGYCSTGCGLKVHLKDGAAINLSPDSDYPVNLGMACPKGWEALAVLDSPERATQPLVRGPRIAGETPALRATSWENALTTFCRRFQAIMAEHGPESVAFLSTGQIPTEEMMLLGALTKFGMGWRHGDSNTRQCMATSAVAYKQSFGFDAPPYSYADFAESDVLVFVGSNLCVGHPILWERVLRNPHRPAIVVIDPRRTETAIAATRHLAIQPKSDQTLFYGITKLLVDRGWIDRAFIERSTEGFDAYCDFLTGFPIERVAAETGLAAAEIEWLAETIHAGQRVSFWWTMGVNQSYQGVRTAQSIINLALVTGNIGRPGTGPNSITGQCNAMGSRLFSNTSTLLGGRDFADSEHRREVAKTLGIGEERIPTSAGLCYDQILERIADGRIRGLWIIATNPVHSWIGQDAAREALAKLDFLVVQDMYRTSETAELAHLVLPAAGWGEKDGTLINSERRIGLIKKVARAPGQALADFSIFRLIAQAWGCGEMFAEWTSPEAVFPLMKRLSAGRPCDITGIADYRQLDEQGGIQWPWPAECGMRNAECGVNADVCHSAIRTPHSAIPTERRLFEDGKFFHASGRAKLLFDAPTAMPEPPDEAYPFVLLTGRGSVSQWHTQTRTRQSAVLRKLYPTEPYVEIHPDDAGQLKIKNGQPVIIASRRGRIQVKALHSRGVQHGQVFLPMHYELTNRLTLPHFDPHSRQPSYKDCAVKLYPPTGQEPRR
jgi:anaerobic selenocysteine-containing dehydrogenase